MRMGNVNDVSYSDLQNAYGKLYQECEELKATITMLRADKIVERMKILMNILEQKDVFNSEIVELANWHMLQLLAKPKENANE